MIFKLYLWLSWQYIVFLQFSMSYQWKTNKIEKKLHKCLPFSFLETCWSHRYFLTSLSYFRFFWRKTCKECIAMTECTENNFFFWWLHESNIISPSSDIIIIGWKSIHILLCHPTLNFLAIILIKEMRSWIRTNMLKAF